MPMPMHNPSATVGPEKLRAKVKKRDATAKDKPTPKKQVWIKEPCRSKRVSEQALDTDSSALEIDERLAKRKRKLTRRYQRKASDDDSWASECSC